MYYTVPRLTEKEKRERDYKKTVLKLAKDHHKAREVEKVNRYYMPKDDVKVSEKYEEDFTEKGPNYEQKRWEEEHVGAAIMKYVKFHRNNFDNASIWYL